ncbi:transketolase (TKT) [Vairimorpha necatrix]|uniref:transketolase n=1 Tax=Vairimorpha necatrix TaxID=6039 RepID=A0AAX4JBK8_9MICR
MNKKINNVRTLVVEMVQKANSGHPGAPLGLAPFVYTLFKDYLNINPLDDTWVGRDIFILSNGHACGLQYVMNYLLGFNNIDDLKNFRQVNSYTPGHPERKSRGIETTTGPLGQGLANSVGFAISLKKLNLDNKVYCIFGDGCYMEGISQESFSIAANLNLNNITFIYDFNQITIDGPTSLSMNENVVMRFESLNYEVLEVDGENIEEIKKALDVKTEKIKMIILHTKIGRDSILEGKAKVHGSPIGEEGVKLLKQKYEIPLEDFYISDELVNDWREIKQNKIEKSKQMEIKIDVNEFDLNSLFVDDIFDNGTLATRKTFSMMLNKLKCKSKFICGSADLVGSCLNKFEDGTDFTCENRTGNYINFGIREHAMFGIMNGISGHGYFIPVFSTFLNFVTYGYPSVRLASLDKLNNIYVLTHDSIGLGEDGPTHQPIEVLATMRATPNLIVMRPCDIKECRGALSACLKLNGPKAVVLSRQKLPFIEYSCKDKCQLGAYYLIKHDSPDFILMGTGSEIELCIKIVNEFKDFNISVISFFSWEIFEMQPTEYKKSILIEEIPKISIEALTTFGWNKYSDYQIGLDRFGWSGKYTDVFDEAGFTPGKVMEKIKTFLKK